MADQETSKPKEVVMIVVKLHADVVRDLLAGTQNPGPAPQQSITGDLRSRGDGPTIGTFSLMLTTGGVDEPGLPHPI